MRGPREILDEANTIAVVGASANPGKSAYSVPLQMKLHGWRLIPVNPHAEEIWGERVYRSLAGIPEAVDMVDVFRPSEEAAEVARQAAAIGASALWLQQGIVSEEARRIAEEAGMEFVQDRCMAVERALGRLSKQPQTSDLSGEASA